jgi:hypothetical protein
MNKRILRWELVGILIISIFGSLLHFVFDWAGRLPPVGAIAAVNESVWEHFKIAFWPALLYAILEYAFIRKFMKNFAIAKAIGIYAIPIIIAIIFYSYTTIVGHSILVIDISSFIIAIAIGQLLSYKILTARQFPLWTNNLGIILLILLAIAFIVFTYLPPHMPVFRDEPTGMYGII